MNHQKIKIKKGNQKVRRRHFGKVYFLGIQPSIDQQISQKGHESQNQVYTIMTMINDFVGRL